jgi:hypothetical protein
MSSGSEVSAAKYKMSGFTEAALEKKLVELNASAQSIQQLSLWLIHHRKHYQVRGRLHVHESVYESAYDFVHDLLSKGVGF